VANFEALPEILTPQEVADYLRVDKETVYRMIRDGRLVALRMGRGYRINKGDFEAFLRSSRTGQPPP